MSSPSSSAPGQSGRSGRSGPPGPAGPATPRASTGTLLLRGGRVYSPADPAAEAVLLDGPTVAWLGSDDAAAGLDADHVVDLDGALVTPAFVDAHVHLFDTGMLLTGVDATAARSVGELLDAVAAAARARPGRRVLGHGWDETRLAERRPPTLEELDRAAGGAEVYLSRVDVHSAVVSSALADRAGCPALPGWDGTGRVERDAHHAARAAARELPAAERHEVHLAGLRAAAAAGITTVHEMSGPAIAPHGDLAALLRTAPQTGVRVVPYWGEAVAAPGDVAGLVATLDLPPGTRLAGLAGDLSVDGSIGSRTAAFREPYADAAAHGYPADYRGHRYLDRASVTAHLVACVRAGVQPGFHVIGDAALDVVVEALADAEAVLDAAGERPELLWRARVRLEHVEAADADQVAALARRGVVASMQPAFDALWGGDGGLYQQRLGDRGRRLNEVGSLAAAGVPLAFGSDSPVTALDPWGAVAAAAWHHAPGQRVSGRAALSAHTRGAHRAAFDDVHVDPRAGTLVPGAPADLAVWQVGELTVTAPDHRIAAWSTDPRGRTPALPDLSPGAPRPRCLATLAGARVVFDAGALDGLEALDAPDALPGPPSPVGAGA